MMLISLDIWEASMHSYMYFHTTSNIIYIVIACQLLLPNLVFYVYRDSILLVTRKMSLTDKGKT